MATYIPNATNATQPTEDKTVESAALEFRTLKGSVNSRVDTLQDNIDIEIVDRTAADAVLQNQINALSGALVGGSVAAIVTAEEFTGDGVTVNYTLTVTIDTSNHIDVYLDGVHQQPSSYTIAGTLLTFSEAPLDGVLICVKIGMPIGIGTTDSALVQYVPSGSGAVPTTVQAKLRETVSVKDFGAVGDGVAIDSTAVQTAIDTVSASGGGTIYIPPGTYIVRNIFMKDNVSIVGDGWASYFKLDWQDASPSNDWKVFTCADASGIDNVEFINVRIDGQQSSHGLSNLQMHGIQCRGPNNNWLIQGCYIYNCGGDPIIVGKYLDYSENPPANIRIIGNTCIYAGRQALSVTECDGVVISGNYVSGPLDLEANSTSSKFYHCAVTGNVVRGNLNVNLYTGDGHQDNDVVISGNVTDYITLVGCNNVVVSGNTITTSLRYGANYNVLIDGCIMPVVDKIGGERTTRMVVRNCTITTAAVNGVAFEIADVSELIIDGCVINSTDANGQGTFHSNVKTFTPTNDNIYITNSKIYGGVRGVNVSVNGNFGVTNYIIDNCEIRSGSTNPAINKTGTGTAGGTFAIRECTTNNQVVIAKSDGRISLVGMRFDAVATSTVVLDGNTNPVFELDDWTFLTNAFTTYMRNCTNFVSLYVGKVHSVGTTNSMVLNFSSNTGTPTVWIDGTNATSTTWFGTIPGAIRTGSYYNLLGDTAKRGQWYNGTSWVNIT